MNRVDNIDKFILGKRHLHPRDGFQFVYRAAGVAELAAGHFSDDTPAGGNQRGQHQCGGIPNATGGVFVNFKALDGGQIDLLAGLRHRHREIETFAGAHSVEVNGH